MSSFIPLKGFYTLNRVGSLKVYVLRFWCQRMLTDCDRLRGNGKHAVDPGNGIAMSYISVLGVIDANVIDLVIA